MPGWGGPCTSSILAAINPQVNRDGGQPTNNLAYSAFACFRMGMSGSAYFDSDAFCVYWKRRGEFPRGTRVDILRFVADPWQTNFEPQTILRERRILVTCPWETSRPRRPFRATRWRASTSSVQYGFRNSVDAYVGFNSRICQSHGTKRSKSEPSSHEAKRLTKMSSFNQNGAVYM
jgi:hypothetical protein